MTRSGGMASRSTICARACSLSVSDLIGTAGRAVVGEMPEAPLGRREEVGKLVVLDSFNDTTEAARRTRGIGIVTG